MYESRRGLVSDLSINDVAARRRAIVSNSSLSIVPGNKRQFMLAPDTRLKDRYRILKKIGGGGFGYVYTAIDEVFGCAVAIKETREEVAGRDKLRKAFEREAKLLRNLKHDSLPRVTDYFFQDEAQFLVMDYIEGEDLGSRLQSRLRHNKGPFTSQEVLPWAHKILDALEYLHNRPEPIIHRDIKPSNIRLTDNGEIYLLDFGLAKGSAGQMSTVTDGQTSSSVPGFTRGYAPLEQLQSTATEPQSDIYAFGATMYHLLTGTLPISASVRDEALHRGTSDPLRSIHELNPLVPIELSEVIQKSLAVRWWDRTESAKVMRENLLRSSSRIGDTIQAEDQKSSPASNDVISSLENSTLPFPKPDTFVPVRSLQASQEIDTPIRRSWFHERKWLAAGLVLATILGFAASAVFVFPNWFSTGKPGPTNSSASQNAGSPTQSQFVTPANLTLRRTLPDHTGEVWSVAFSPTGSLAATASADKTVIIWDATNWTVKSTLREHSSDVNYVAFSPDGKILATGSSDKTIKLWNPETGVLISTLPKMHTKRVLCLEFSPDGKQLASCSGEQESGDKEIRLWDINRNWETRVLGAHDDAIIAVAFSSDNQFLVSAGYDSTLRLWNLSTPGRYELLKKYERPLTAVAFSKDGKLLACGSSDNTIKLWSYSSGKQDWVETASLEAHKGFITAIAFAPDSTMLASSSADKTLRLWNVHTRTSTELTPASGSELKIERSLAFSPDGQTLISGGQDNMIRVWQ